MAFTRAIYDPLLATQPRSGVRVVHNLVYGPDKRHRLDIYQPDPSIAVRAPIVIYFQVAALFEGTKLSARTPALLLRVRVLSR